MKSRAGFFIFFLTLAGCNSGEQFSEITILWKNDQATSISIPQKLIGNVELNESIRVTLVGDSASTGIFGDYKIEGDAVVFEPLIPFTRGLTYSVFLSDKQLATVKIPFLNGEDYAVVTGIYPSQDTLPENTLKLYLTFSKPMKKGEALKHLFLVRNGKDTITSPFLDMTNELWNTEGTILTLWFDPGRVKRELQPNLLLGAPLEKGNRYQLIVGNQWKDVRGAPLASVYSKSFLVDKRDETQPEPQAWRITAPPTETFTPLKIELNEPLDYLLVQSVIRLTDEAGNEVSGKIELTNEEKEINFIPDAKWKKGNYTLHVEGRLEDLAGNNLERPFDRDLNQDLTSRRSATQFKRKILIQ